MEGRGVTVQLTKGDRVALGGAIALLAALFLPWYGLATGALGSAGDPIADAFITGFTQKLTFSAFDVFTYVDVALVIVAIGCVAIIGLVGTGKLDQSLRRIVESAGSVAALLVLFRMLVRPGGSLFELKYGIFLALIGGVAISVGGMLNRREFT